MIPAALIILCLLAMFLQDLRYREIHVALPVVVFASAFYLLYNKIGYGAVWTTVYNLVLISVIFLFMVFYMSIKTKRLVNPFRNYFGLGDLLFFIAVAPLFFLSAYLMFFIGSMVFTIICYYAFKRFIHKNSIPLAGFASLLLLLVFAYQFILSKTIIIAL